MALVRKRARAIDVGGVRYHWTMRRRPTYCQGNAWSPATFAVEDRRATGSVLVVSLPAVHPGSWLRGQAIAVRPGLVASAIRLALARGWTPSRPGSAFQLELTEAELPGDTLWFTASMYPRT